MQSIDEQKKAHAYWIWEREGRPEGRSQEHWELAQREMDGQPLPQIQRRQPFSSK
jgi:hypothetical protein